MRVCIIGSPRSGKSTLADKFGGAPGMKLFRTDDLIESHKHLGADAWSALSLTASKWFDEEGPWVLEGVRAVHALRKWMAAHPDEKPCEVVVRCWRPLVELTEGQLRMFKGVHTVWHGIERDVIDRGVGVVLLSLGGEDSDSSP